MRPRARPPRRGEPRLGRCHRLLGVLVGGRRGQHEHLVAARRGQQLGVEVAPRPPLAPAHEGQRSARPGWSAMARHCRGSRPAAGVRPPTRGRSRHGLGSRRGRRHAFPRRRWPSSPGRPRGSARRLAQSLVRHGAPSWSSPTSTKPGPRTPADALSAGTAGATVSAARPRRDATPRRCRARRHAPPRSTVDLDFMFNNAGIGIVGPGARDHGLAHWTAPSTSTCAASCTACVAAYPVMVRQGRGHIVNTASLAGLLPAPMLTALRHDQARRGRAER